uniref:Uncharacterized protein n=1 Tax=Rhizophora mucronata TaxID=61149 RepID=A0A2P2MYB5_RHIMU
MDHLCWTKIYSSFFLFVVAFLKCTSALSQLIFAIGTCFASWCIVNHCYQSWTPVQIAHLDP